MASSGEYRSTNSSGCLRPRPPAETSIVRPGSGSVGRDGLVDRLDQVRRSLQELLRFVLPRQGFVTPERLDRAQAWWPVAVLQRVARPALKRSSSTSTFFGRISCAFRSYSREQYRLAV